jgi:hypothetical protein
VSSEFDPQGRDGLQIISAIKMKNLLSAFKAAGSRPIVLCLAAIGFHGGCAAPQPDASEAIALKLAAPREFAFESATDHAGPFEKQFRIDTSETHLTRRTVTEQSRRIQANSKDRMRLKFDLSEWPESLRPSARLWVGIGASNAFTTEVTINLVFTQNGTGVSTGLNNLTSIDGVALMGCDFALQDGEVTVEIENRGLPRDVDYKLHTITYVPKKLEPMQPRE